MVLKAKQTRSFRPNINVKCNIHTALKTQPIGIHTILIFITLKKNYKFLLKGKLSWCPNYKDVETWTLQTSHCYKIR